MPHIEVVSATATQPNTGLAMTAVTGDSLVVKNARVDTRISMLALWVDSQVAGFYQLLYPTGHDQVRGIRGRHVASQVDNHLPEGVPPILRPQDQISLTISGSNTAADVESLSFLMYYEDLPGIAGNFIGWEELGQRLEKVTTVEDSITPTAASAYTGARALNAGSDLLLPNRDYALLGADIGVECCTLGIRCPDFGNVRVGIPGNETNAWRTISFFGDVAFESGLNTIPVINSGNKASTLIDVLQDENTAVVPFALHLALLSQK